MHVLVGVDGTDGSLEALERALERAREAGDDLTVAALVDADDADATTLETRIRDAVSGSGVDATVREVGGTPASSLVELADSEGFDRLVVAGGRRSPLGKINLDSFTEFVLLNATTSVTLIR